MIIGYARVSTQDQNSELQVDALEKAGAEQVFQEKLTGKLRERPVLSQCLRTLRKGDVLVVWKLDRLARSLKDLVEIVQDLHGREIGFKSLTESIDTTSSGGRLVFHIFGALAEFEHDLIRERTIAGLKAARARGRKGGRKPAMSDADVKKAAAMLLDPNITKKEVAEHFVVARTTLNASLNRLKKG
ncbi:recombinase family protein [Marinobacter sp. Arc7-DN-1]|uniref:recombinase family protein n=1 Tax=Marinobacter sp. Arc7-DN-1 TaxID=2304594 RepID=UPI000E43DAD1|nr:recombinase family protein [Marinobacter sp. Arc7-DN-1]AXS84545.1 recombinase family protein [Marinobacter sp. Arc7-DN-1]